MKLETIQRGILILGVISGIIFPYPIINYLEDVGQVSANVTLEGIFVCVALVIGVIFDRKRIINYSVLPFFLIVFSLLISGIFSKYGVNARVLRAALLCNFIAVLAGSYFTEPRSLKWFSMVLGVCVFFQAVLSCIHTITGSNYVVNFLLGDEYKKFGTDLQVPFGFTKNSVLHGLYMLMGLGISAYLLLTNKRERLLGLALCAPVIFGAVITASRAVWLGFSIAILGLLVVKKWTPFIVATIFFTSSILVVTTFPIASRSSLIGAGGKIRLESLSGLAEQGVSVVKGAQPSKMGYEYGIRFRLKVYRLALEAWMDNPILGVGVGRFSDWTKSQKASWGGSDDIGLTAKPGEFDSEFERHLEELALLIVKGPRAFGYPYNSWNLGLLHKAIGEQIHDERLARDFESIICSDTFKSIFRRVQFCEEGYDTHNMYLTVLAELGSFGALSFLCFFLILVVKSYRIFRICGIEQQHIILSIGVTFLGFCVVGLFWHILYWRPLWWVVGLGIGVTKTKWEMLS